jgi:hypothetical protein
MAADFASVFAALRPVLVEYETRLSVRADTSREYTLVTKSASPFPQHKGQPMDFGSVRVGKAYVSFHLMPIYMCPTLEKGVTPALKARMQGKSCFNFKVAPPAEVVSDLRRLTEASFLAWCEKGWV